MKISVVVCTYNRKDGLLETLESIAKSIVPIDLTWEVLVVDNNSTDGTEAAVHEFIRRGKGNVQYLRETRQGKSFALNAGIRKAQGHIIAFTDDDVLVAPNWLAVLSQEFDKDPSLSGLGGKVLLYNEQDLPIAIRTSPLRQEITRQTFDPTNISIIGCNIAFLKRVFDVVGLFDLLFGPGSQSNVVCEDVDLIYRVHKECLKIVYAPESVVFHNHGRRTEEAKKRSAEGYLIGRGAFYCKYILAGDCTVFRRAFREVYGMSKEIVGAVIKRKSTAAHTEKIRLLIEGARTYVRLSRKYGTS